MRWCQGFSLFSAVISVACAPIAADEGQSGDVAPPWESDANAGHKSLSMTVVQHDVGMEASHQLSSKTALGLLANMEQHMAVSDALAFAGTLGDEAVPPDWRWIHPHHRPHPKAAMIWQSLPIFVVVTLLVEKIVAWYRVPSKVGQERSLASFATSFGYYFSISGFRALLEPAAAISVFFVAGPAVILLNKYIMRDLNFQFPILVANLGNVTLFFTARILVWSGWWPLERPELPEGSYFKLIVPLSLFTISSLVLGNWVYLYLSVPLIQMLKGTTLVLTMLFGFVMGTEQCTCLLVASVITMVFGLSFAITFDENNSQGESRNFLFGLAVMFSANVSEAGRALFTQVSVEKLKFMDSIYWCTPSMTALGLGLSLVFEFSGIFEFRHLFSFHLLACLFGSAVLGGLTSFTSFWIMKFVGGLSMKVLVNTRNLALVLFAIVVLGEPCSAMQYVGYAVALVGIALYDRSRQPAAEPARMKADEAEKPNEAGLPSESDPLVKADPEISLTQKYMV